MKMWKRICGAAFALASALAPAAATAGWWNRAEDQGFAYYHTSFDPYRSPLGEGRGTDLVFAVRALADPATRYTHEFIAASRVLPAFYFTGRLTADCAQNRVTAAAFSAAYHWDGSPAPRTGQNAEIKSGASEMFSDRNWFRIGHNTDFLRQMARAVCPGADPIPAIRTHLPRDYAIAALNSRTQSMGHTPWIRAMLTDRAAAAFPVAPTRYAGVNPIGGRAEAGLAAEMRGPSGARYFLYKRSRPAEGDPIAYLGARKDARAAQGAKILSWSTGASSAGYQAIQQLDGEWRFRIESEVACAGSPDVYGVRGEARDGYGAYALRRFLISFEAPCPTSTSG